jgi:hypothetical protein
MLFESAMLRSYNSAPVTLIADRMATPVRMNADVRMPALETEWFHGNPHVSRSQIVILITHNPNVFVAIPDIGFRNDWSGFHDRRPWRWRRRIDRSRRRRDIYSGRRRCGANIHAAAAAGFNDTSRCENQRSQAKGPST